MPVDTHAMYLYGDRTNQLMAAQAVEYCPERDYEIWNIFQKMPGLLMQTSQELHEARSSIHRERHVGRRTYLLELDNKLLAIISRHQPITLPEMREILPGDANDIYERLRDMSRKSLVSYSRTKPDVGWRMANEHRSESDI